VKRFEQRLDLDLQLFAAALRVAWWASAPLVEPRLGHTQPAGHLFDGGSIGRRAGGLVFGALRGDERVFLAHRCSFAKYAAAFFRKAFSISSSRVRRSSSRNRARSDNSSGGSSAACAARYFFTQPPTVVSLSPYSRATSMIDRFDSTTSFATSSRNSGVY